MIAKEAIEQIKSKILENFKPEKIIFLVFQVTGQATKSSDIDLLIIMYTEEIPYKKNFLVRRIFSRGKFSLDVFVFTPEGENI